MASEPDPASASGGSRIQELVDENSRLRLEVARLKGHLDALLERLSAQDAADEHHRVELEAVRARSADAHAELQKAQVRVEEWRRQVSEAREHQMHAERQRDRAEQERAAVIAVLGRRARKQLGTVAAPN